MVETAPEVRRKSDARQPSGLARGLIRTARPRQWVKNLLVFAGPLASGSLLDVGVASRAALTLVAFTLMASGVYFLNDAMDVNEDRAHPTKRFRPIASGVVSVRLGYFVAVIGVAAGLAVCAAVNADVLWMGLVYVAINIGYSLGLKNVAVVDLLIVAGGFILRAYAGVFSVPTTPTVWFSLMALFGSLLLVAGKRSGERAVVGDDTTVDLSRKVQAKYTDSYLQFVREFSAAGLLMAYGLMALQRSEAFTGAPEAVIQMSVLPFLATVMLLVKRMDEGGGAAPEDLVLRDRGVLASGLLWLIMFGAATYLGNGSGI